MNAGRCESREGTRRRPYGVTVSDKVSQPILVWRHESERQVSSSDTCRIISPQELSREPEERRL